MKEFTHIHTAKCQHQNHKNKCYGENIYNKVDNEKRLNLLNLVKEEGKSLKEAAKSLNINYSTAKTILRVFRIENRILKKSPYQKRSRRSHKNKIFNFHNGEKNHNEMDHDQSQSSEEDFELDHNTITFPGCESNNNINLQSNPVNSLNKVPKESFMNLTGIFKKEKNLKEKNIILQDSTLNFTNVATQSNNLCGKLLNSPLLNSGSFTNNTSRVNSYPTSSNPSNNNLTNLTDFNLNSNSINNSNNIGSINSINNKIGLPISSNSNFVCASNYALANGNANNNRIGNSQNLENNFNNNLNHVLQCFINSNNNYNNNSTNDIPEIFKNTEEFMEGISSLVNLLRSCIGEIINNEYTIKSLTNIIRNMKNNSQIQYNPSNMNTQTYNNYEQTEIKQQLNVPSDSQNNGRKINN